MLQVFENFGKALIPAREIFLQAAHDDPRRVWRQLRVKYCWISRDRLHASEHELERISLKGKIAGNHLVKHQAEGVDVGASVDVSALDLLGRHVPRRTEDLAGGSHRGRR